MLSYLKDNLSPYEVGGVMFLYTQSERLAPELNDDVESLSALAVGDALLHYRLFRATNPVCARSYANAMRDCIDWTVLVSADNEIFDRYYGTFLRLEREALMESRGESVPMETKSTFTPMEFIL